MNQPQTHLEDRFGKYLFAGLSAILCIWVIYRAFNLSITNDEAFTFYNVATHNIKMMCGTANTHWLNSFFVFIETVLIGNKEWMIRIHSILGFLVFTWAIYRVSASFISNFWHWLIPISLLLLNIYVLDFFSLARGYALSMAFELLAFWFHLQFGPKSPEQILYISISLLSHYKLLYLHFYSLLIFCF
jgi:hypothetical protein